MGIIWTNAIAQDKANNAEQGWYTSEYWGPIYCDGEEVDFLEGGVLRVHYVSRYVAGVSYKEVTQLKGQVTSSKTGEVFKVRETDKTFWEPGIYFITWHYNLIGNMGTHYNGTLTLNMFTGEITIGRTVCH